MSHKLEFIEGPAQVINGGPVTPTETDATTTLTNKTLFVVNGDESDLLLHGASLRFDYCTSSKPILDSSTQQYKMILPYIMMPSYKARMHMIGVSIV
ncbi:MAG: hypothetical protein EZS28_022485 [Streblomastix strix]|uniref:Uncharacterized protein n=1 Tax=Streblomastix strix TaxID=222440 RepID=A0A5J4VH98_9EUKA|nr:MAG: hypothetical protein EZS28_022485 [Streblomastix strix]